MTHEHDDLFSTVTELTMAEATIKACKAKLLELVKSRTPHAIRFLYWQQILPPAVMAEEQYT